MKIMDCTLRDGANVLGNGFPRDLTEMMLRGLVESGIPIIEYGNAKGLGAYEVSGAIAPLTDDEYLELAQPYLKQAAVGMFLNAKRFRLENVKRAAKAGLDFLRIGSDAGDFELSKPAVFSVKEQGLKVYYALMKAYLLTPEELAEEAVKLEEMGVDEVTVMDSAGTMRMDEVERYMAALKMRVQIPVGFHGHNNLGLSSANALAAAKGGADIIDCGLLGMARSAGNISTELAAALFQMKGIETGVDFWKLLDFLDKKLVPAMEPYGYVPPVRPLELILGFSGCHSSFLKLFKKAAQDTGVNLFRLICEVSSINRKNPEETLILETADRLSKG